MRCFHQTVEFGGCNQGYVFFAFAVAGPIAMLWVVVILVVLIGGGVAAYFGGLIPI